MAIKFLYHFVIATLSTATVAVNAQTFAPLRFAGVNIAGFDFGCGIDGTCIISQTVPPVYQLSGVDGLGQMQHFVQNDGYNVFRLPVGWQYLTYNQMTGVLNETQFANYNMLVSDCLSTGALCEIDIHNYARYDGEIIGQGGPSNEIFAELWYNIASYWKNEPNVIFGVMNEPHDIPVSHSQNSPRDDVNVAERRTSTLGQSLFRYALFVPRLQILLIILGNKCAVTAIRETGATTQMILLPGNNYTSAQTFVSSGSAEALGMVRNPDGTITNLIMDVHKYLDYDNSGTHAPCVTNNIEDAWYPLSTWLRENGRQALNTETGGGNVDSCVGYISQQIGYQAANSDVILGYLGWSAGSFAADYVLSQVPYYNGTGWNDTLLVSMAMSPMTNMLVASVA
ncbi:glycoside hydrolase family 5 protein [Suillus paluster]|uniref:glycoside hydrolase family 5 protein n=1 Tax=Suillus paluster TaxID=48578 RepID=UPI001B8664E1|nr:glycoside hydrolase family 5 protein [Suillus paluster]KAG1741454.1 glycoside hydrolase family 5 protein [Suillus paluster]